MIGSRPLTPEEIAKFKEVLSPRDRLLLLMGIHFGTRLSESLACSFRDFEGSHLFIRSMKRSANARFPIPDPIRQGLEDLWADLVAKGKNVTPDTPIFYSQKSGAAITKFSACKIIQKSVEKLGLVGRITSHSFRKSFVSRAYYGVCKRDPIATMKFSRHKNLSNLVFYVAESSVSVESVRNLWEG